jgi:hypothetical protein
MGIPPLYPILDLAYDKTGRIASVILAGRVSKNIDFSQGTPPKSGREDLEAKKAPNQPVLVRGEKQV